MLNKIIFIVIVIVIVIVVFYNGCTDPYVTRCTRGVHVVFSVTRMRSSNSARINKFDFRTEKIVQCTHDSVRNFCLSQCCQLDAMVWYGMVW